MRSHNWEFTGDWYQEDPENRQWDRKGIRCSRCGEFRKVWQQLDLDDPALMASECTKKMSVQYIDGHSVDIPAEPSVSKSSGLGGMISFGDVPDDWKQQYAIVRISGELTWVSAEKLREFTQRRAEMGGDWSWEQQIDLDRLVLARERMQMDILKETIRQKVMQKRHEMMILDQEAVFTAVNERVKQDWPRPGVVIVPPPDGPTPLQKLKRRRRSLSIILIILVALAFSNAFTMEHVSTWLQYFMVCTWLPAAFVAMYQMQKNLAQIRNAEIKGDMPQQVLPSPPVTPRPRPQEPGRKKSAYEGARDMYVQTGKRQFLEDMLELVASEFPTEEVDYTI